MGGKGKKTAALRAAIPNSIPVMVGFGFLGAVYGILMQTKGYGIGWSVLMSALAFCGSMQFVAITLLTTAFHPLQAFLMSLMVNARHLFYGISMLEKYKGLGKVRAFLIFTLCDETFSIASSVEPPQGVERKDFYFFISLLHYLYWIAGTAIGGLLGGMIHINTEGLDFALTALFVVLLMEQLKKRENIFPALLGIAASVLCLHLFGQDNMVIPSMILIVFLLAGGRRRYATHG